MTAFEDSVKAIVRKREQTWEDRFMAVTDQLLNEIEEGNLAGRQRLRCDSRLWRRLAECADAVREPRDPPSQWLELHEYVLGLQERFQIRRLRRERQRRRGLPVHDREGRPSSLDAQRKRTALLLLENGWSATATARVTGLARSTLYRYGLAKPRAKAS